MGQVLHGSTKTKHAVRAAIQRANSSTAALSQTYGINSTLFDQSTRQPQGIDIVLGIFISFVYAV